MAHVAVRGIDDNGRSVDHVIAGKQKIVLFVSVANMVRRMSGRVHRVQAKLIRLQDFAVRKYARCHEGLVLMLPLGRWTPEYLCATLICKR